MQINPVSPTNFFSLKNNSTLTDLFKLAEKGMWDQVFLKVEKNPNLLNEEMEAGPDAGKTLLFLATFFLSENSISFLEKVFKLEIPFNMDATPIEGPDKGKTVLWNLAYQILRGEDNNHHAMLLHCLAKFKSDINAAPKEGPFKDMTVFCLLAPKPVFSRFVALQYPIINKSAPHHNPYSQTIPSSLISMIHHIETKRDNFNRKTTDLKEMFALKNTYSTEEILNQCYDNVIKIFKECSSKELNMMDCCAMAGPEKGKPLKLLDMVLSLPPSPNRDTLYSLILAEDNV